MSGVGEEVDDLRVDDLVLADRLERAPVPSPSTTAARSADDLARPCAAADPRSAGGSTDRQPLSTSFPVTRNSTRPALAGRPACASRRWNHIGILFRLAESDALTSSVMRDPAPEPVMSPNNKPIGTRCRRCRSTREASRCLMTELVRDDTHYLVRVLRLGGQPLNGWTLPPGGPEALGIGVDDTAVWIEMFSRPLRSRVPQLVEGRLPGCVGADLAPNHRLDCPSRHRQDGFERLRHQRRETVAASGAPNSTTATIETARERPPHVATTPCRPENARPATTAGDQFRGDHASRISSLASEGAVDGSAQGTGGPSTRLMSP